MRIFAQKPRANQATTSTRATIPARAHLGPSRAVTSILYLQRTIGNQAVQRLLEEDRQGAKVDSTNIETAQFGGEFSPRPVNGSTPSFIQAKLTISTPGDQGEQEADRAAEQVMRMPDQEVGSSSEAPQLSASTTLQRMCEECAGAREEELQGKGGGSDTDQIDGRVASEIQAVQGSGLPLSKASRAFFEPRFGYDFTAVRIHADSRAAALARSVIARAFTLGRDIVFGSGEYSPESGQGKYLLAHELAHIVQQREAPQQIQRLSVTQHKLAKGTCGQRNVQWIFSLDKPAPADGYIVQQIDRNQYVETCPDVAYGPPAPLPRFWEAWFVKKGDKVDWTTVRDKWTDGSTRPARPGTNGMDIAAGTIKFFSTKTTGDLGDFGKAPADPKSPWGPGKVSTSGALPSTPSEPSWWGGASVEGPADRGVWASWNCCDADKTKHSSDLKTKP